MLQKLFQGSNSEPTLQGRQEPIFIAMTHAVSGRSLHPPYPENMETACFGMGCFWGAERKFWQIEGAWVTAAGYAGGTTPNATYREVCSGRTGHAEVVLVLFDPGLVPYRDLLVAFWEGHDPTQLNRQGNDIGSQYRSVVFFSTPEQLSGAEASRDQYASALNKRNLGPIATEIVSMPAFYFAEEYHQQYLAKNPDGYCGLGGTGVVCPAPADSGQS